jgi:hypothetical protein
MTDDTCHAVMRRTAELRSSLDPFWIQLRGLLQRQSIDPASSILAMLAPEDGDTDWGFIVTRTPSIFGFTVRWDGEPLHDATLESWQDWTSAHQQNAYALGLPTAEIQCALELLAHSE